MHADDRLAVGAGPFVREVYGGAEEREPLCRQLGVELLHVLLDRRALEAQAEIPDRP